MHSSDYKNRPSCGGRRPGQEPCEKLTDRQTYQTDIGAVCMSKEEHRIYLERLASESPEEKAARLRPLRKVEAVIFDMDGVLIDSERLLLACWTEVAGKHHLHGIREAVLATTGVTRKETEQYFFDRFGRDFPYRQLRAEVSGLFHAAAARGQLTVKPGAHEILSALEKAGVRLALASSTRRKTVEQELAEAGLLPFFEKLICGDMIRRSKPAPDIYLAASEALDIHPDRAYAIEDSYNGIRSCSAAGMHPIMVPDLLQPDEEIAALTEFIAPSLAEAQHYLELLLA